MTDSHSTKAPRDYFRADIEGLRGISIALVVLFHAKIPGFQGGFVGVDVFYVLSGFLITGLLLRERHSSGTISLRQFYARRVRRLLPAAVVVLAVTLIASYFILPRVMLPAVATDGAAAALYLSNMNFARQATDYFASTTIPSPFLHYWSLSVEEQYYLFWPAIVLLLTRRSKNPTRTTRRALFFIGLVSFIFALWLLDRNATWAFFSLPSRAWELALGGLLAVSSTVISKIPPRIGSFLSLIGVGSVVYSGLWLTERAPFPGWPALLPTVGTGLVIVGGTASAKSLINRVMALQPLRFLGRISYSLYLWHWPVLILPIALSTSPLSTTVRTSLMFLGILLAWITNVFIEKPLRKGVILGLQPRWNFSFAAGTALIMVAAAVGINTAISSQAAAPTSTLSVTQKADQLDTVLNELDPLKVGAPLPKSSTEVSADPTPATTDLSTSPTPTVTKTVNPLPTQHVVKLSAKPSIAPVTTPRPKASPTVSKSPASSSPTPTSASPAASPSTPSNASSPTPTGSSPTSASPSGTSTNSASPSDTSSPSTSTQQSPSTSSSPTFNRPQTIDTVVPKNLDPSLLAAKTDRALSYKDGCHTQQNLPASTKPCIYGNPNGTKLVVLFGDSHALAWFPAVNGVAKANGWKLLSLTMSACSPASIPAYDPATKAPMNNCPIWRKASIAKIVAAHPYLVLISGTRGFITLDANGAIATGDKRTAIFDAGMKSTINAIKKTASHVILIQDVPAAGTDPVICLSIHTHTLPCATSVDRAISASWQAEEVSLANSLSIGIIDPSYWICPSSPCPVVLGNLMIYADTGHLTATFSGALTNRLKAAITRSLAN